MQVSYNPKTDPVAVKRSHWPPVGYPVALAKELRKRGKIGFVIQGCQTAIKWRESDLSRRRIHPRIPMGSQLGVLTPQTRKHTEVVMIKEPSEGSGTDDFDVVPRSVRSSDKL